jgi:drug/metabolite transporter (DMT)-like permease
MGAAVLFAVMLARREKAPRSIRLWATIAIAALFANAVPYLLFAVAEQSVSSSTAGIINATTPLWTAVLALAVRHHKTVTRRQAAGLITGFTGALLIFSPWRTASELLPAGGWNAWRHRLATPSATSTWTGSWPAEASEARHFETLLNSYYQSHAAFAVGPVGDRGARRRLRS